MSEQGPKFDIELTSGPVWRSVWKLAWPLVLLNLTKGVHAFIDHVLVGHYVGSDGNAAIGLSWGVFLVLMVFITSLFHGMSVLVAQYAGKQDRPAIARIVYSTMIASLAFIFLVVGPIGYILTPRMLDLVHAWPAEKAIALPYLRIMFTMSAPLFVLFLISGALQACGHARLALSLGVLTAAQNIVVSYILITGAGPFPAMGASGAAIGTCLSPLLSIIIVVVLSARGKLLIEVPRDRFFPPDWTAVASVMRIGLPAGLQAVVLNIGGVILLRYLGGLVNGAHAHAVQALCYGQLFMLTVWTSFALRAAAATVIGQNIGAGHTERGKRGVYIATGMGVFWAALVGILFFTIPDKLLALFNVTDPEILEMGRFLLRILSVSGIFLIAGAALTGGLQGAGDTKSPLYVALIAQIVVVVGVCALLNAFGLLTAHAIWYVIFGGHILRFALTFAIFKREKWRDIRVELRG